MPRQQKFRSTALAQLGDLPLHTFLNEYWQQKPLLVRGAFSDFHSPVSAEELAGLALEEDVESRLIVEDAAANPLQSRWQVSHGPFTEDTFGQLPERHWTLLVQAVDQLLPEVAQLLNKFRFLPNWRLDDVMISYAADQGSVGPHYDHYDVFLLQGEGKRRWRLGERCHSSTPVRTDTGLRILTSFDTEAEYLLEPGDMLYIPPQVAHWGVAEGPCMTYSIGFRAPSYEDIILDFSQDIAAQLQPDQRYTDDKTEGAKHPGEISPAAVKQVQQILTRLVRDEAKIADWLGRYGTEPKRHLPGIESLLLEDASPSSSHAQLKPTIRAAYVPSNNQHVVLYLNSLPFRCSLGMAQSLSSYQPIELSQFRDAEDQALINTLLVKKWLHQPT